MFKNTKIFFQKAIVEQPDALSSVEYIAKQLVKRYRILNKINKYQSQLVAKAIKYPRVSPLNRLAIAVLNRRGQVWQVVDLIENITVKNKKNPRLYYQLGMAQNKMHRFDQAAESFCLANRYSKGLVKWKYMEGLMLQRAGKLDEAEKLYVEAVNLDKKYDSKEIGIGALHYQYGYYQDAVETLEKDSAKKPSNSLMFKLLTDGYFRLSEWHKSELNCKQAISLDPDNIDLVIRLANLLEKQEKYSEATACFESLLEKQDAEIPQYQLYRYGFCLYKLEKYKRACEVFGEMYKKADIDSFYKTKQADLSIEYFFKGLQAESESDFISAVDFYSKAIDSTSEHVEVYYYKLASMLASVGKYHEACANFIEIKIFKNVFNQPSDSEYRSSSLLKVLEYNELFDSQALDENMILYESYHGKNISCNPFAIFRHLIVDVRFKHFMHVWVINDIKQAPKTIKSYSNVVFVKRDSQQYRKCLTKAKYLINNNTFPDYFIRKQGQLYLNTWHGTPLKSLGNDIAGEFNEHANANRNFIQSTHLISPNKHTANIIVNKHDISTIYTGKMSITGYPRNDTLVNHDNDTFSIKKSLGIDEKDQRPIVLYAPTWRGSLSKRKSATKNSGIEKIISEEFIFIYQGHHLDISSLGSNPQLIIAPAQIDTTDLLAITDVLITDYSSIFFDFVCTKKPILLYAYDIDDYQKSRGLYFPIEDMPGEVIYDIDSLKCSLNKTLELLKAGVWKVNNKYQESIDKFASLEDGKATKRVVDFLFNESRFQSNTNSNDNRERLLFYVGPFIPNGITTVAINLLNNIDFSKYKVALAIDKNSVASDVERLERISQLSDEVEIVNRFGYTAFNPEEKKAFDKLHTNNTLTQYEWELIKKVCRKEYKRIFGNFKPDFVINFEGYARFWSALFAVTNTMSGSKKTNLIYQHNDMYREYLTKYPYLKNIFYLYRYYKKLVSVSEGGAKDNLNNLSEAYGIPSHKFIYADNPPDISAVVTKSEEPLDEDLFGLISSTPKGQLFVTFGRLSPEKNHILLLETFKKLIKEYPLAKLVILGEGPLRGFLEHKVSEYMLDDNVYMPGNKPNPFPLLKRADCFVLSSIYEGLGMVLLEAMALRKPIISTRISAVRALLNRFEYGLQVDLNSDSMLKAMKQVIANPEVAKNDEIDLEAYRIDTLKQFYHLLK